MRKRTLIRDVRNAIPDRALDLASRLGDGFRNGADGAGRWFHDAPGSAGHWLQAECGARVSALLLDFLARNYR